MSHHIMDRISSTLNVISSSFFSLKIFLKAQENKSLIIIPFLLLGQFCLLPALELVLKFSMAVLVSQLQIIYGPTMPSILFWPPQPCWHTALGISSDKTTAARKRSINSCYKLRGYLVFC